MRNQSNHPKLEGHTDSGANQIQRPNDSPLDFSVAITSLITYLSGNRFSGHSTRFAHSPSELQSLRELWISIPVYSPAHSLVSGSDMQCPLQTAPA